MQNTEKLEKLVSIVSSQRDNFINLCANLQLQIVELTEERDALKEELEKKNGKKRV